MAEADDMEQRPPVKGPAIVRLAGWIILAFSVVGLNPVGVVAGIVILRYADRIAGKIAEKTTAKTTGTAKPPVIGAAAGAEVDDRSPGRDIAEKARGAEEVLTPCPFCRKLNKPNAGKCGYCGYAM
jgi:hypothetical protein